VLHQGSVSGSSVNYAHEHWGTQQMVHAVLALSDAVDKHAEHVLTVLEPQQNTEEIGFRIHLGGVRTLFMCAREELSTVDQVALTALGSRRQNEESQCQPLETVFPNGQFFPAQSAGKVCTGIPLVRPPKTWCSMMKLSSLFYTMRSLHAMCESRSPVRSAVGGGGRKTRSTRFSTGGASG
jgi:hypothetical protein